VTFVTQDHFIVFIFGSRHLKKTIVCYSFNNFVFILKNTNIGQDAGEIPVAGRRRQNFISATRRAFGVA